MLDEKGDLLGYRGINKDITKRRLAEEALRESEERFRRAMEATSDGLWDWNVVTGEMYFSPAYYRMLGYEPGELPDLKDTWLNLIHPDDRDQALRSNQDCIENRIPNFAIEFRMRTKNGDWKWILGRGKASARDANGQALRMIGTHQDITERRQVERMKDQFVSTVSHELRTPLTSIRASLGLLGSGVGGALPEKGQRMLEIAVTNTDRLVRLINDILDTERLASGKTPMEKKQCSTAQLVKQATDVMKPMAEKAGISFSIASQDAELWADPDRIVQALTNLISNAIKFSSKGGRIWVAAERKENQMLFRVQDEGRGIPPDKLGILFERFQQVDSSDAREKGGSGLGLSISRSIIEQHNGKIWVESTVGKGSTFFFTIPLQETHPLPEPKAMTGTESTRTVLIIEDDLDLAKILAAMLQRHDIQPTPRTNRRKRHHAQQADASRPDRTGLGAPRHGWLGCGRRSAQRQHSPIDSTSRLHCERTRQAAAGEPEIG